MSVSDLFEPLTLAHGPAMRNRFMLAPLTNQQSEHDGSASPSTRSGSGSSPGATTP